MLGFGLVQRAVSVPLISSTTNAFEAQQVEYLLHGDLVAKPVEVDTRHGWSFLVEKKATVPFPLLYGERERSFQKVGFESIGALPAGRCTADSPGLLERL